MMTTIIKREAHELNILNEEINNELDSVEDIEAEIIEV